MKACPLALGFSIIALILYASTPKYNWDMLPYIAVSQLYLMKNVDEIHNIAYKDVKKNIPRERFDRLTEIGRKGTYRNDLYKNPTDFYRQLPFYSVKPLYPALIEILHELGFSLTRASIFISKISMIFVSVVSFLWMLAYMNRLNSIIAIVLIFSTPGVLNFAGYSTPDPLFALIFIATIYVTLIRDRSRYVCVFWPLLVLCRPDAILFIIPHFLYLIMGKKEIVFYTFIAVLIVLQYIVQTALSGNYGWHVLFYHSFVKPLLDPTEANTNLNISQYIHIYMRQFFTSDTFTMLLRIALTGIISIVYMIYIDKKSILSHTMIIVIVFSIAHWLAFPGEKHRLLFPAYLVFSIGIVTLLLGDLIRVAELLRRRRRDAVQSRLDRRSRKQPHL